MGDLNELVERLQAATMTFDWADLPDEANIPAVPLLRQAAAALTGLIAERDDLAKWKDQLLLDEKAQRLAREAAEAQLKAAREALEKIACRHVTEQPLWWQIEARAALSLDTNKGDGV